MTEVVALLGVGIPLLGGLMAGLADLLADGTDGVAVLPSRAGYEEGGSEDEEKAHGEGSLRGRDAGGSAPTRRYFADVRPAMRHGVALAFGAVACAPTSVEDALARDGDPQRGHEVFDAHCADCHGSAGQGTDDGPDLTDRSLTEVEVLERVLGGWGAMDPFDTTLSARQAADLAAWLEADVLPAP